MLKYKVREMLEAGGIKSPGGWLIRVCDIPKGRAYKILKGKQDSISSKDLSKLCENLHCTPNNLLYWHQGGTKLPATHPIMLKLTPPRAVSDWYNVFKHIPRDKIAEIQQKIIDEYGIK